MALASVVRPNLMNGRHFPPSMVASEMGWFETFSSKGLYFPAFMIAFGSLVILRAPSTKVLSEDELSAASSWIRWLARHNTEQFQRRNGWVIIGFSVFVAILRIAWDQ